MSLRSKVSISVCLLLVISIFIYGQVPTVHSWAWNTHYFIETKAELVFSSGSLFSNNHSTLQTWCVRPDSVKNFMPDGGGEADWHWLDAYSYDPLPYQGQYDGQLPWAMQWIFDNIVQYLEAGDWTWSVQLLGAICHFTGDATMPLHATWNYNPGGRHSAFETEVNNHLYTGEISIPDNYVPQYLDNITYAALVTLAESFSFTREGSNPGDNNLTDFLLSGILWNDWIRRMTENRIRAAVQFTANVWYTAMIRAGMTIQAPTLTSPSDGSTTTDDTPTFTWTSVDGTNFYDFQLASDNEFTADTLTVKSLSTTSYTLVEPLTNGEWYWRVRTGDNSTHIGLWSQTWCFTVQPENNPWKMLIAGWNMVGFAGAGDNDTPNNIFTGLNYYTDYFVYYWNAPGGPYALQDPDTVLKDNTGYLVWINQNKTVSTTGTRPDNREIYLVTGWNLVGFPVVDAGTTPNNVFTGLSYYTDYIIYYWNAPGGPYGLQDPDTALQDNLGYLVWINQNKTVTVP